jgi:hypothetical protein
MFFVICEYARISRITRYAPSFSGEIQGFLVRRVRTAQIWANMAGLRRAYLGGKTGNHEAKPSLWSGRPMGNFERLKGDVANT